MPIAKKIKDLKEPLDIDLQLMASELDTSVKKLRWFSRDLMEDGVMIDAFVKLTKDIEVSGGVEIASFNDNTVLFEYLDEAIVVHDVLGNKFIIFDSLATTKIENRLYSYR